HLGRLGDVAQRPLERTVQLEQVLGAVDRDPVQHDRRDDLVGADRRLHRPGDPAPHRPGERRRDDGEGQVDRLREAGEVRPDDDRRDDPDHVLALAADVEHPALEGQRDRQRRQHERRRQDQRLLQVERSEVLVLGRRPGQEVVQAGAVEDRLVGLERVVAGERHDEAADREGQHRGADGEQDGRRLGAEPGLDAARHTAAALRPPIISTPRTDSLTSGVCSATIRPSYMTRMRSESDRISSSSKLTSRMATPSSRTATSRWWTNSIAPTSSPRVGWAATRIRRVPDISRATTTFCWFPPEREPARVSGPPPRTSYSLRRRRARSAMARGRRKPHREAGAWRTSRRPRFSARVKSSTSPRRWRSSGIWPTPASKLVRAPWPASSWPSATMSPDVGLRRPVIASTSSLW